MPKKDLLELLELFPDLAKNFKEDVGKRLISSR